MKLFLVLALFALTINAKADRVTLNSGGKYEGIVLQTNEVEVLLLADYGTVRFKKDWIKSILIENSIQAEAPDPATSGGFLPNWRVLISKLAKCNWASTIRQIPATVIDQGIMKNVPYLSFTCANNYEINIYGDLDNPAGIEIGLYKEFAVKEFAMKNAVEFISQLPLNTRLADPIKNLNWETDGKTNLEGITMEITLPSAPDAYGAWWISLYSEAGLEGARMSKSEIEKLTEPIRKLAKAKESPKGPTPTSVNTWTQEDLTAVRRVPAPAPITTDIQPLATDTSYRPTHNSGSVYVPGYYRKNGTYVHSYSRSR